MPSFFEKPSSVAHSKGAISSTEGPMMPSQEPDARGLPAGYDLAKTLQSFTQAARTINSLASVGKVMQAVTEEARSIIGAHQAITRMVLNENNSRVIQTVSL